MSALYIIPVALLLGKLIDKRWPIVIVYRRVRKLVLPSHQTATVSDSSGAETTVPLTRLR